jgi:hypothetical protein
VEVREVDGIGREERGAPVSREVIWGRECCIYDFGIWGYFLLSIAFLLVVAFASFFFFFSECGTHAPGDLHVVKAIKEGPAGCSI